jgi:small-conductance mechanosensitive channel
VTWFSDLRQSFDAPMHQAALVLATTVFAIFLLYILKRVLIKAAKRTKSTIDDIIIDRLYRPVRVSILLYGFVQSLEVGRPGTPPPQVAISLFMSIVVIYWFIAALRITDTLLQHSTSPLRTGILTQRSMPFFQMASTAAIGAMAIYFLFLAWDLDLTAWLASAGILGIAVGFGAKDSLANVFGGVSIMADAPYKLGDYLLLETGERGVVTDIGLRSTRLRTRGDIQIVVPNSIMSNTKIVNESGGPRLPHCISLNLGVAYGTNVDALKAMVIEECKKVENVLEEPPPIVFFIEFGDSALIFDVLVSIQISQHRAFVLDELHMVIYKRLNAEGIVIPFPQRDVHMVKS